MRRVPDVYFWRCSNNITHENASIDCGLLVHFTKVERTEVKWQRQAGLHIILGEKILLVYLVYLLESWLVEAGNKRRGWNWNRSVRLNGYKTERS